MKSIIALMVAIVFSGCANVSTVKVNRDQFENRDLLVVPTGKFNVVARADSNSATAPGLVGALVALADAVQAATYSKKMSAVIPNAVPPDELSALMSRVITENIQLLGNPKKTEAVQQTRIADNFTDWFNPDNRLDIRRVGDGGASLAIDFGFHELRVVRYTAGMFVEGALGMRLIDLRSGAVLARSRVWGVGAISGERIQAEIDDSEFEKAVQSAIRTYVTRLSREAMAKMANNS